MGLSQSINFTDLKQRAVRENGMELVLRHFDYWGCIEAKGDQARGPSPFDESSPQGLSVNLRRCVFNVFGGRLCGPTGETSSGDIFGAIQVLRYAETGKACDVRTAAILLEEILDKAAEIAVNCEKVMTNESVRVPAPSRDVQLPANDSAKIIDIDNVPFTKRLKGLSVKNLPSRGVHYFRSKGITEQTIREFGAGLCHMGYHKGRIVFPIIRRIDGDDVVMAYISRAVQEGQTPTWKIPVGFHPSLELGYHPSLYNPETQELIKRKGLILVKGVPDQMWLLQQGFFNVIATFSESVSDAQIGRIQEMTIVRAVKLFYNHHKDRKKETPQALSLSLDKLSKHFWTKQIDYESLSYLQGQAIPNEPEECSKAEIAYLLDQNPSK